MVDDKNQYSRSKLFVGKNLLSTTKRKRRRKDPIMRNMLPEDINNMIFTDSITAHSSQHEVGRVLSLYT